MPDPPATTNSSSGLPVVRPEAEYAAEFRHTFPEGKENGNGASGGITAVPVPGQPFYGFDGDNHSSATEYLGEGKTVSFQMRLLKHHDGKDIYEITRTVTLHETKDNGTSETKGAPKVVTVEYAGEELKVFDDEHGVSRFVPYLHSGEQE